MAAKKKAPPIRMHVPAVRVTVNTTKRDREDAYKGGGEYFETCYEVRARTAADFRSQVEAVVRAMASPDADPKATRWVAFIGIGRSPEREA